MLWGRQPCHLPEPGGHVPAARINAAGCMCTPPHRTLPPRHALTPSPVCSPKPPDVGPMDLLNVKSSIERRENMLWFRVRAPQC